MEFFDVDNKNPVKLRELLKDLKRLGDKALLHIAGLARELVNRK